MFSEKYQKIVRNILVSLALGLLLATSLKAIHFDYADALFLDLRQFIFQSHVNDSKVVYLDLSSARDEKGIIVPDKFEQALDLIHSKQAEKVILATSLQDFPNEERDGKKAQRYTLNYPEFSWYADWGDKSNLLNMQNAFLIKESPDTKLGGRDSKLRRLFLSFDCVNYDEDFVSMMKHFGLPLKKLESFGGLYRLFGSCQIFFKQYNRNSFLRLNLADLETGKFDLKGKIIFVGALGAHNVSFNSIHIFSRFNFVDLGSMSEVIPAGEMLINYYESLKRDDYIRTPSLILDWTWIFIWIFFILLCLVTFGMQRFIFCALFSWPIVFTINLIVFKALNLNLDLSRVFLGLFIIQVIGIPYLVLKHLRKLDAEAVEKDKELERERFKTRFVLKAARADLNMQLAAKVSHDIRSPLMALQVASSFLKGKVASDVENLVGESLARLKFIAEDVLKTYRAQERSDDGLEWIDLREQVQELLKTYTSVHREVAFQVDIPTGLNVCIPRYAFQRCLANLLNNSIEAGGGKVKINITSSADESSVRLVVGDDGPGVPSEIRTKLFQERSTFGKKEGTGLGLFQVRRDLSVFGAAIRLQNSDRGAVFEMSFPRSLSKIPFEITKDVLVLESEKSMIEAFSSIANQINLFSCSSVGEALALLNSRDRKTPWTVFVDLVQSSEEETGFDFIEKVPDDLDCKIVMCTSFADNAEVQQLALKYQSLLLKKSMLYQLEWKIRGN